MISESGEITETKSRQIDHLHVRKNLRVRSMVELKDFARFYGDGVNLIDVGPTFLKILSLRDISREIAPLIEVRL